VLVGGLGAGADYLGGKAYDPIVKPLVTKVVEPIGAPVVNEGKKVIHFVGGLLGK
jgi:hypothetical protein